MEWSFVFFLNSALLGVGLAMDAFSVSMANGLHDPKMGKDTMCRIAGTFGVFQAVMPMTGWICVHTIVELFSSFETFIPWIALALLGYNQWDANRADKASQDALGKLEETLTETIEDKTKDEEPVVQPELDRCLEETARWMKDHGVDYESANSDGFQVVLVGGFGKYLLVQKQVEEFFRCSSLNDARFRSGLGPSREYAVSMGAALLASGVMTIRHTAPYGIGICTDSKDLYYAIPFRQEIKPGMENWICTRGKNPQPVNFFNGQNSIAQLLIGTDEDQKGGVTIPLLPAMSDRIADAYKQMIDDFRKRYPNNPLGPLHNIGFSMDESEVVSILFRSVDTHGKPLLTLPPIELADYTHMFGFNGATIL